MNRQIKVRVALISTELTHFSPFETVLDSSQTVDHIDCLVFCPDSRPLIWARIMVNYELLQCIYLV